MKTNIVLGTTDIIVLAIVFALMAVGVRLVIGFFHEGKPKKQKASTYSGAGEIKMTLQIDGMMCGQCETHINNTIRKNFPDVEKVSSSHTKGETIIIAPTQPDERKLQDIIGELGYQVTNIRKDNYSKLSLKH